MKKSVKLLLYEVFKMVDMHNDQENIKFDIMSIAVDFIFVVKKINFKYVCMINISDFKRGYSP